MPTLSENLIREISSARGEPAWLLDWRCAALVAWKKMTEPHWAEIDYAPIDYDALNYYNEPKPVDNSDLRATYEKMGLPDGEQRALLGMATDTVIDSRSVHTSYTDELKKLGIIFLPFSNTCGKSSLFNIFPEALCTSCAPSPFLYTSVKAVFISSASGV